MTFLRVLAGVFHDLSERTDGPGTWDDDQVTDFLASLAPETVAPVAEGSMWVLNDLLKDHFDVGAYGPLARSQNLKGLTAALTEIATGGTPPEKADPSD